MSLADRSGPWGSEPYGQAIPAGDGTAYLESSPKRIRIEVGDTTIADSAGAFSSTSQGPPPHGGSRSRTCAWIC